jgi:hypothetical protein
MAAIYQQAPPFVTYRVATHVSAPAIKRQRDIIRSIMVRTRDDRAVIQDLPKGRNQVADHAWPVTPTFDVLSDFQLSWYANARLEIRINVYDVKPLVYQERTDSPGVDVIVTRLRSYKAEYAADSSDAPAGNTHVTLVPFQFVTSQQNPEHTFYFSDLYINNANGLPSKVTMQGLRTSITIDYGSVEGHWLVTHVRYEDTLHGPLQIGFLHVIADAVYSEFAFPATAPDPRLSS